MWEEEADSGPGFHDVSKLSFDQLRASCIAGKLQPSEGYHLGR